VPTTRNTTIKRRASDGSIIVESYSPEQTEASVAAYRLELEAWEPVPKVFTDAVKKKTVDAGCSFAVIQVGRLTQVNVRNVECETNRLRPTPRSACSCHRFHAASQTIVP
jgi:hypothetical protein